MVLEVTEELARIHAHLCGDGSISVYKTSEPDRIWRAQVVYTNTNPILIEEFRRDMQKVFNVSMYVNSHHDVIVKSKRIVHELMAFGEYGTRAWRIPKQILESPSRLRLEWLYAFFKDEAYIEKRYNRIRVKSMNRMGLSEVKSMLASLGVASTITGKNIDGSWYLTIPHVNQTLLRDFKKMPSRSKNIAGSGFSWGQDGPEPILNH